MDRIAAMSPPPVDGRSARAVPPGPERYPLGWSVHVTESVRLVARAGGGEVLEVADCEVSAEQRELDAFAAAVRHQVERAQVDAERFCSGMSAALGGHFSPSDVAGAIGSLADGQQGAAGAISSPADLLGTLLRDALVPASPQVSLRDVIVGAWLRSELQGHDASPILGVVSDVAATMASLPTADERHRDAARSVWAASKSSDMRRDVPAPVRRGAVVDRVAAHIEGDVDGASCPAPAGGATEDRKRELYVIMEGLTAVVAADVRRFREQGGELRRGEVRSAWPLQADRSTLRGDQWRSAVERAAQLMSQLPSPVHDAAGAAEGGPLGAVLDDIAEGYEALAASEQVMDVVESLVRAQVPLATPEDVESAVRRSRGLVTQLAALNANALDAALDALSVPSDQEGGWVVPDRERLHASNFRFDPQRWRVEYRKPITHFLVPKAVAEYEWLRTQGARGDVGAFRVADVIIDDMASAMTMTCPALGRSEPGRPSPLVEQWEAMAVMRTRHPLTQSATSVVEGSAGEVVRSADAGALAVEGQGARRRRSVPAPPPAAAGEGSTTATPGPAAERRAGRVDRPTQQAGARTPKRSGPWRGGLGI